MLVPMASEANRKYKDFKILEQQRQYNDEQVEKLHVKLNKQGVPEKEHSFFARYLVLSFFAFVILLFVTMYALKKS